MEWWAECAYWLAKGNDGMAIFVAIFVPPFALLALIGAFAWSIRIMRRWAFSQLHASKTLPAKVSVLSSAILLAPALSWAEGSGEEDVLSWLAQIRSEMISSVVFLASVMIVFFLYVYLYENNKIKRISMRNTPSGG